MWYSKVEQNFHSKLCKMYYQMTRANFGDTIECYLCLWLDARSKYSKGVKFLGLKR